MSKIIVIVQSPEERRVAVIARLRSITRKSVDEINKKLRDGDPLIVELLWFNDHEEVAARLRAVLSDLPPLGASLRIFELGEDEEPSSFSPQTEISPEILENILASWDET